MSSTVCLSVRLCFQAKSFHDELQDTLQQLSEIDAQLMTSQPVGGLPDTARKQLEQLQVCVITVIIFMLPVAKILMAKTSNKKQAR